MRRHGWFYESHRHRLAAHGIKTSKRRFDAIQQQQYVTNNRPIMDNFLGNAVGGAFTDMFQGKENKPIDNKMWDFVKDSARDIGLFRKEQLVGGKADNMPDEKFDPQELAKGMEVEKEHTSDQSISKEIAKDHIEEIPDYYERLEKMENEAKAEEAKGAEMADIAVKSEAAEKLATPEENLYAENKLGEKRLVSLGGDNLELVKDRGNLFATIDGTLDKFLSRPQKKVAMSAKQFDPDEGDIIDLRVGKDGKARLGQLSGKRNTGYEGFPEIINFGDETMAREAAADYKAKEPDKHVYLKKLADDDWRVAVQDYKDSEMGDEQ